MYDFHIPFGRTRCVIKVQQKVGAFRTQEGADTFCAIRSYIQPLVNTASAIDAIYNAFNQPFFPSTNQA